MSSGRVTRWAAAFAVALAAALGATVCGTVQPDPTAAFARTTLTTAPAPPSTTTAPTTVDPGSLPQTLVRPSTADPAFAVRVQALWAAVVNGQPDEALPFFFPLSAYLQVKAVADPASDWRQRLVADYDQDITALHTQLAAALSGLGPADAPVFLGISVPGAAAVVVKPGAEFNKLSYWRVYNSHLDYRVGSSQHSFLVASMISWRGEWYVVHLSSIR